MALEELESRCDQLQRRMTTDKRSSPTRVHTPTPTHSAPSGTARAATPTSAQFLQQKQQTQQSDVLPPQPHEIAFAVQRLEQDKARLEGELRLVNAHLATYRYLMKLPAPLPSALDAAAASAASRDSARFLSTATASAALGVRPKPSERDLMLATASTGALRSPPRTAGRELHSPAHRGGATSSAAAAAGERSGSRGGSAGGAVVPSALPNDQIAEELRRIRRAREERESQRRLSAALAGGGSPSSF